MQQPLIEYRLTLAGVDTRALELEGDGPPLLLLHGYADSADTWRSVLARLGREGRRALAVDLPGFGTATRLDRAEGVLPQLDRFAAAAIRHLAAESGQPVVVAGNSLGGCVALRLAAWDDLPLAAIVPIGPAGFDHPVWFSAIEAQPVLRHLLAAPVPLPEAVVRAAVGEGFRQLAFAHPRTAAAEAVAAFTQHHRSTRDLRRYLATGRRMLPELVRPFDLQAIRVPVLLIWGDHDRMVRHQGSRHLMEALPDMRYELLPDVGHCPQIEVPETIVRLLQEFGAGAGAVAAKAPRRRRKAEPADAAGSA
ncbi:2-hydroxy-6-oxo-6-(2'-aminophenyl)hexa-2,4-dienoic acid hydrolase [Paraconexibacter sp. AEG42_29]|uniref:2-hydroxy-6-oxo-6-(2'-aminophenyl)hexa-2, 4-dienoic acid hydrolase n=1 Tax=Paraconexibacter sp. AEG42_29 TaxID=2997339 RepID=A0AAU7B2S0_9ACTN